MQYRRFGKLNWEEPVLRFGVMLLPLVNGDTAHIDEAECGFWETGLANGHHSSMKVYYYRGH
jgi:hypothetical protein